MSSHRSFRPRATIAPAPVETLEPRIAPAIVAPITVPPLQVTPEPDNIVAGANGSVWFSAHLPQGYTQVIGRVTSGGTVTDFLLPQGDVPSALTVAPDGNLYFILSGAVSTNQGLSTAIGWMTPAGVFTEKTVIDAGVLTTLAVGPDGNIWFGSYGSSFQALGMLTPDGAVSWYSTPTVDVIELLTTGPDGNLWYEGYNDHTTSFVLGEAKANGIVKQWPLGSLTTPPGFDGTQSLSVGPDGNLWGAVQQSNGIDRITTSGVVAKFTIPTAKTWIEDLMVGPDGNLWFTQVNNSSSPSFTDEIDRMTPAGVFTAYTIPSGDVVTSITAGSDGNVWFTLVNPASSTSVGFITPSGSISEFTGTGSGSMFEVNFGSSLFSTHSEITAGSDGNLWFTEPDKGDIGRAGPDGTVTEFAIPPLPAPVGNQKPGPPILGPDGNLWFTEAYGVARMSADGTVTEFPSPDHPVSNLVIGSNDTLWYESMPPSRYSYAPYATFIDEITTDGIVSQFPLPSNQVALSAPTEGSDGTMWFNASWAIARITPQGVITEFPVPLGELNQQPLTLGPDGNMWFGANQDSVFSSDNKSWIGRITPDGVVTEFATPSGAHLASSLTVGPDGSLWVSEGPPQSVVQAVISPEAGIARVTPAGVISEFGLASDPGGGNPGGVVVGADGNLWVSVPQVTDWGPVSYNYYPGQPYEAPSKSINLIERVTPAGVVLSTINVGPTSLPLPWGYVPYSSNHPFDIQAPSYSLGELVAGPDGSMWTIQSNLGIGPDDLVRISSTGQVSKIPLSPYTSTGTPTIGPDGNLWFNEPGLDAIERVHLSQLAPPVAATLDLGNVTIGQTFTQPIVTLNEQGLQPSDISSISIDWGDGTAPTAGTAFVNANGGLDMVGTHDYFSMTPWSSAPTIVVTITFADGSELFETDNPALTSVLGPLTPLPITGTARIPIKQPVGTIDGGTSLDQIWGNSIDMGDGRGAASGFPLTSDGHGGWSLPLYYTYANPGTYTITVSLTGSDGTTETTTTTATIAPNPSPLLGPVTATPIATTENVPVNQTIVTIGGGTVPSYIQSVQMNWGDGTSSSPTTAGLAVNAAGLLTFTAGHTYTKGGIYIVLVRFVGTDGSVETATTLAQVAFAPRPPVAGSLNPASDSGESSHDGITNVNDPGFLGTAAKGATVKLFALAAGQSSVFPIGQTTATSTGAWAVQSIALADGSYTIFALAVDDLGHVTTAVVGTGSPSAALLIDARPPTISDLAVNPLTGRLTMTVTDSGGVDPAVLLNASDYQFGPQNKPQRPLTITPLALLPGGPGGTETVAAKINGGKRLASGHYTLTIPAGAIVDRAGNAATGLRVLVVSGPKRAVVEPYPPPASVKWASVRVHR